MPRIPDAELSRLKQAVPLTRLAEARGRLLERAGSSEMKCLCVFHDEATASLHINTEQNVFHCFGCGAKGDVIAWVRRVDGLSFPDAVTWLQDHDQGKSWRGPTPSGVRRRLILDCPLTVDAQGDDLLAQVVGFYHTVLVDDPLASAEPARTFLQRRRLFDLSVQRRLRIGFDDRSLGPRLPRIDTRAGMDIRTHLAAMGLYRESGHAHFVGSVTVPIEDATTGRVVSLYGRRAQKNVQGIRHVNLPGPRRGVFNAAGCRAAAAERDGAVILCEAVCDALSFICHGQPHATACLGTNGYTADIRAFLHAHARTVFLAFDRDEAGESAYPAIAEDLIGAGATVYRVQFPPGSDANDVLCRAHDPADAMASYLRTAIWLGGRPSVLVPELPAAAPPVPVPLTRLVDDDAAFADDAGDVVAAEGEATASAHAPSQAPASSSDAAADSSSAAGLLPHGVTQPGPDTVALRVDDREWWARGWQANTSYDRLRLALRVRCGERVCGDTIDVASLKQRQTFIAAAASEIGQSVEVLRDDLGKLWLALETLQDRRIRTLSAPKTKPDPVAAITPERRAAALRYLQARDLLGRIRADVAACGLVGEGDNATVLYLAAVSRKLADPLAVLVQATSAAGKSSLQDTVLALVPEEDRYELTAISSRALFYAEPDALKHKALSIAEQEGADAATYSLKLMQSAGRLSIMVPVKDPDTNEMSTKSRTVEGPVAIFMTTTAAEIDEELQNRFLVLTVDESPTQTAAVQAAQRQRETLDGFAASRRAAALRLLHHDVQRLLQPIRVFNPYAPRLTFAGRRPRGRRDHAKYLRLIRAITFLNQYQRERHTAHIEGERIEYIETAPEDIAEANAIAAQVLGRGLDELAPQTRRLWEALRALANDRAQATGRTLADVRLSRREILTVTGWSYRQIHIHLSRLVDLDYLQAFKGPTTSSVFYGLASEVGTSEASATALGLSDAAGLVASTLTVAEVYRLRGKFTGSLPPPGIVDISPELPDKNDISPDDPAKFTGAAAEEERPATVPDDEPASYTGAAAPQAVAS